MSHRLDRAPQRGHTVEALTGFKGFTMHALLRRMVAGLGLACAGAPVLAAAAIAPLQLNWVLGDGSVRPIDLRFVPDGPVVHFSTGEVFLFGDGSVRTACDDNACDGSVRIEGTVKTDPFIHYSVGITDIGAPTQFTFSFGAPSIGGPYNTAVNQLSAAFQAPLGGLTSWAGFAADFPSLADDPDLTLGPADCATPSGCAALGSVSKTGSFPSGAMGTRFTFTGSGNNALYELSGGIDLFNARVVDEPAPLALLAGALALLGGLRRRRV